MSATPEKIFERATKMTLKAAKQIVVGEGLARSQFCSEHFHLAVDVLMEAEYPHQCHQVPIVNDMKPGENWPPS